MTRHWVLHLPSGVGKKDANVYPPQNKKTSARNVAAVVRAFVPARWQVVGGEFGVRLVLSRPSRFKCSVGNLRRRTIVGKVHNAPFAFCFRAVGLQPLVEGALADDDDRCSLAAFVPAVRQLVRHVVRTEIR